MNNPIALMRALDLQVASKGPSGRYPRGEPGPRAGFRYWANFADGQYRFGVQAHPKAELSSEHMEGLKAAGFEIMPARTEAYVWVGRSLEAAVDQSRVTMAIIAKVLAGEKV